MDFLRQVQRGIEYVEAHLEQDIALRDVSAAAGISHWHFQRIFKAMTMETLATYVRSRRLANSLDALRTTDDRILDIAVRAGFGSQEAFTRAFKRSFSMTPSEYRRLRDRSLFLEKVCFDGEYLRHINRNVSLVPEIYTQPAMTLVGMQTFFHGVDSDKNNIGERLPPLWESFMARLGEVGGAVEGVCFGVVRQAAAGEDRLDYHAAVQVTGSSPPPPQMVELTLPQTTYAKFAHRGAAADIDRTVNYIYSTWLANSGRRHTYQADLEIYDHQWHPTSEQSVMYYAIPIE